MHTGRSRRAGNRLVARNKNHRRLVLFENILSKERIMRMILPVYILIAVSIFIGCQKKHSTPQSVVRSETKKLNFVPPADSSETIDQIIKMNACNLLLDSLSIFYQDSFKTKDAVLLSRYQEDFSRAQDGLCFRAGLPGGYNEYLWLLKNLGNPKNAKLLDSLKMTVYQ